MRGEQPLLSSQPDLSRNTNRLKPIIKNCIYTGIYYVIFSDCGADSKFVLVLIISLL
jgi:hypothetical protein